MRKPVAILSLFFILMILSWNKTAAQSFIDFSKTSGSNQGNIAEVMQVVNGETYVVYCSLDYAFNYANNFRKIIKYARDGSVVYTTNISLDSSYGYSLIKVVNGEAIVVLMGATCAIVKLNTAGDIAFSVALTSTYLREGADIPILGDEILLCGSTVPGDFFPLTMGGVTASPDTYPDFIAKMKISDGSITGGKYLDFHPGTNPVVENNALYYACFPGDSSVFNLPVTMGSIPSALPVSYGGYIYVRKINLTDFSTVYARFVSESAETYNTSLIVHNGQVYLNGSTHSHDLYVTNGSSLSPGLNANDGFYTKLNADGSIAFSTYLSTPGYGYRPNSLDTVSVDALTGNVYILGTLSNGVDPTDNYLVIYKFSASGSQVYFKRYNIDWPTQYLFYAVPRVINDELYFADLGMAPGFPVTDGTQYTGTNSIHCVHFDPSGNIIYAGYLGRSLLMDFKVLNNKMYISSKDPYPADYLSSDGSLPMGLDDNLVIVLNTHGTRLYRGYTGGSSDDDMQNNMQVDNGSIYINGTTWSDNYPVTQNILLQAEADYYLTKISFCPDNYAISNGTLFPKTQTVCKYGVADLIKGRDIILPGDSLPPVYRNGLPILQPSIEGTTYQWQKADAAAGPWTDIPYATSKNYRPVIANADQYYRRRAFMPASCGSAFIHTSDTAVALVNTLTAPTINAGGTFVTCPGSPVIIGGSPTATGGNPPYTSYAWDQGLAAIPNPTVSPLNNMVYTLTVTDAAGCTQIDQAVVVTYKADAGSDKSNCAGSPVRIGNPPIAGVPGVVYSWQPATDLSSATVAQPFANPPVQTEYDFTLTIPKSGGGTCITYDTMKVTPVAAPLTANFAGPDKTTCADNSVILGMPAEAGFSYTWTLSSDLSPHNGSYTTYSAYNGNQMFPANDPREFQVTAYKSGCAFSDRVVVTTIISNAGFDYCGPRLVGEPDLTPNINETYSWVKVSGPGNFTGATNLPQVPVSASVGDSTIYGLTVSYNGVNCYDEVVVPVDCQSGCEIFLNIKAPYVCPDYSVNNGHVILEVSGTIPNAVYTWTPQQGLSTYTGNTVSLTDDVPRTYIVTVTNALDTSMHCSMAIPVNDPSYALPEFPAPDTVTCSNTPVMIGLPSLPGYTYSWGGPGLSNDTISNPIATTFASQNYTFEVGNGTGCFLPGTVIVHVQDLPASAGDDRQVCTNAIITLGTPPIPNTTYSWEPQSAPWQNGTNEFSAQPDVLVATSVSYTLTTTSSAGCISTDEMNITVNNSPTLPDVADVISCLGMPAYIGSPAITGVSYQWFPAAGLSDPTASQPFATPPATTTYTVTANFPGACSLPATDQVTVTVKDISFHMPDIHFCRSDGAVTLGTNAPVSPDINTYFWQPDNFITGQYTVNAFADPAPDVSTVFNLTVYSSDGCNYTDTFSLIPVIERPLAGADRTICKDQLTNIGSSSNTTGASLSYNWSPVTDLDDPAGPNPVFTGTTAGSFQYILTKTDNSIPCSITDTVVVTVVDIVPSLNSPTICRNSCVQIGTSPVAGITYQWSPAIGLSDASISNPMACIDTASTIYTLTVSDQAGCITNTSVVIGVNAVPGVQASVPGITACVGDNNVMLVPSVPAGSYSYLWSPDDGTLSDINIANPIVQTTFAGATQYGLQITDNTTGCSNTLTTNVTVNNCTPYGQAGNFVWFDNNENGIQDPAEIGVSGVVVKLYNNLDFNVATTVTDANGNYDFQGVSPGNDYYIIFSKPAGYDFTIQNAGGANAQNNSKADVNGRIDAFDLTTGMYLDNIDAGIKPAGSVPVTLLYFNATLHNNRQVYLDWQTTAEFNNDHFDVERSIDGINFIKLGAVNGHGTTVLPHNYASIDPHPVVGINYYRLRQVDFDGNGTYSRIVPIELANEEINTVYYDDINNVIHVIFNKPQNSMRLKLFAADGKMVKSVSANNITGYTLQLPVLARGIYIVQVIGEKSIYSKKIFISR